MERKTLFNRCMEKLEEKSSTNFKLQKCNKKCRYSSLNACMRGKKLNDYLC